MGNVTETREFVITCGDFKAEVTTTDGLIETIFISDTLKSRGHNELIITSPIGPTRNLHDLQQLVDELIDRYMGKEKWNGERLGG